MIDDELNELASRHRVSDELRAELQELLQSVLGRGYSILPTLSDLAGPVSLPGFDDELTDEPPEVGRATSVERYEDIGLLGKGGMGEVRRVRDADLNRVMAMKVVLPTLAEHDSVVARFVEEAQATAQLQHPGIVAVHELGRLADGRLYFTMAEVRGRTLGSIISEVHQTSSDGRWERSESGWTFRRLVATFHQMTTAVAYAHSRGVIHRDLKPENIMVGDHGEVLVVDWGLAKVLGRRDLVAEAGAFEPVVTDRSRDELHATQYGAVAGTPRYMPPEQAKGEVDRIDARSDVYSLGAILYEILSGHAPYPGRRALDALRDVIQGPPSGLGDSVPPAPVLDEAGEMAPTTPAPPEELVHVCMRAMARAQEDRYPDAAALGDEVMAWLDGEQRRARALELVARAQVLVPEADALLDLARIRNQEAEAELEEVPTWAPEEDKLRGWTLADEAEELRRRAELLLLQHEQLLKGALTHALDLQEAHEALASFYRRRHQQAEATRHEEASTRAEMDLRAHSKALPPGNAHRTAHLAYLHGAGAVTLLTDPPGAEVRLYRYTLHHRRLVPVFLRVLGRTPLRAVALPMGSYLLVLRAEGRAEVRYPVQIGRQQHWDGVPPGQSAPHPVYLPHPGELDEDDVYVPPGWTVLGGDPVALDPLPKQRLWVDGVVFRRFAVTNNRYIDFLDDLVRRGEEELALRHCPRERSGNDANTGRLVYGRRFDRGFQLEPDADGDLWMPDWPVGLIDWSSAAAYCQWLAQRSSVPWRLPGEVEWEKAARGVDGRYYPWGDNFDAAWACTAESHAGRQLPADVGGFPVDESPFGVRGMAGNGEEWCGDPRRREGPQIVRGRAIPPEPPQGAMDWEIRREVRGGTWSGTSRGARCAYRTCYYPGRRGSNCGIRPVRSFPQVSMFL